MTGPSTSMACAIPLANTVFPAPSGPDNTTTSPARNCRPSRAPRATVSSAVGSSAVPPPRSAMVSNPVPDAAGERDEFGGSCALDEPHQRVVDDLWLFELHEMPGAVDDQEFGLRKSVGHLLRVLHRREQVLVTAGDQGGHLLQGRQTLGLVVHLEGMQEFDQRL